MWEKDMAILMGEFKAKIGYEEVKDRQGLGTMNENGKMFADLCAFNRLIIVGSVFP